MDRILMYLLEANVLIVLLTVLYLLIRRQLSFHQRRLSLLAIPALAFSVLLMRATGVSEVSAVYQLPVYELNALSLPAAAGQEHPAFYLTYDRIYLLGVLIMIVLLCYRVVRIFYKLRKAKKIHTDGIHILHLENETCYSFFNYVQLNPALPKEEQELVLEHEKIHMAQKHSYDNLFMQLVQGFNWFNPATFFLKKELINVHEYEVDQIMYDKHKTAYMEFLLCYSLRTNSTPHILTNQFYSKNTLIKRLHFMKTKTKNRWAFALAIPAVAGAFALISWTFNEPVQQISAVTATNQVIEDELEKMPEFKGGQEALVDYLVKNIAYPQSARENKIEGNVMISFVVEASGKISKTAVKKSVHPDLDNEAMRVVSGMPDWNPGEKNGKAVNVEMILPVSFKL